MLIKIIKKKLMKSQGFLSGRCCIDKRGKINTNIYENTNTTFN